MDQLLNCKKKVTRTYGIGKEFLHTFSAYIKIRNFCTPTKYPKPSQKPNNKMRKQPVIHNTKE